MCSGTPFFLTETCREVEARRIHISQKEIEAQYITAVQEPKAGCETRLLVQNHWDPDAPRSCLGAQVPGMSEGTSRMTRGYRIYTMEQSLGKYILSQAWNEDRSEDLRREPDMEKTIQQDKLVEQNFQVTGTFLVAPSYQVGIGWAQGWHHQL